MKVNSREFQRNFARFRRLAEAGQPIHVTANGREFVFQLATPTGWRGALKGQAKIRGDLFDTGLEWESGE